jgi:ubiquinone/menaquinone biosynthesis C-methylase UbiE
VQRVRAGAATPASGLAAWRRAWLCLTDGTGIRMSAGWRQWLRRWHPEGIPWPGSILYNAVSRSSIFERHYRMVAEDLARYCRSGRVLDIGTGPGWLLLALQRSLPDVEAVGVDISAAMVSLAAKNLAGAGGSRPVEIRRAGVDALPVPDDSMDAVVSTGSLHHWKDPVAGLNEIHRVLKPDRYTLLYDLVSQVPAEVSREARAEFGVLRTALLWLHSLEEPFYSAEEMAALAAATRFGSGQTRFVGVLCCLVLRKKGTPLSY